MSRSQGNDQREFETDELSRIASSIGTKAFFLSEQEKNLEDWADRASQIFRYSDEILRSEYEIKSTEVLRNYSNDYDDNYARCKKQFDAYCILNRKVQKKNDEIENLANYLNQKNTKGAFFAAWKQHSDRSKYIRRMEDQADKYYKLRVLKSVLKQWLKITMDSNKTKIKNEVLQKTEIEVARIQGEYEKIIKTLEETLEKKLNELKKEEEEHKLLHDKYQAMYSRAPAEQVS